MQRHFSNRGEALAEVTAARMLVGRKRSRQSAFTSQACRRTKPELWFSQPVEATRPRPKRKQPNPNVDVTTFL
jgi:hypothetical protein